MILTAPGSLPWQSQASPSCGASRPWEPPVGSAKVRGMSAASAICETHISNVFLIGDRAYKLKKPVRTSFLDFSTPEARRRFCEREVQLNRRFSPDVYLGVATILDTTGQPCDSVVVMKRSAKTWPAWRTMRLRLRRLALGSTGRNW